MRLRSVVAGLGGFVVGGGFVFWRLVRPEMRRRRVAELQAADHHGDREVPDDMEVWDCRSCYKTFHDEDDAKDHAVRKHDAPSQGALWTHTYTARD